MVIRVAEAPDHPLFASKWPKDGMMGESRKSWEPVDPFAEGIAICFPQPRGRSALALFNFRTRRNALRPACRQTQRSPFHDCSLKQASSRACISESGGGVKRIVQVTYHLVSRHPAPARGGCGRQILNPPDAGTADGQIRKTAHAVSDVSAFGKGAAFPRLVAISERPCGQDLSRSRCSTSRRYRCPARDCS